MNDSIDLAIPSHRPLSRAARPLRLAVFGAGYVGLVTAVCLAESGHRVVCIDNDPERIESLRKGIVPIHEPGLAPLLDLNQRARRLQFTTEPGPAIDDAEVIFIAVGTPSDENGSADLQNVLAVARAIGERMREPKTIVVKSTVPVGSCARVRARIGEALEARGEAQAFSVVSNPEFLKEGCAVADFMNPDRIVVGAEAEPAFRLMRRIYRPLVRYPGQWLEMDVASAEFTKYACNAMLATRISLMNEFALLAERLGVDIEQVRAGMGSDPRIGRQALAPGCGFGGSCLPKDLRALVHTAESVGQPSQLLSAVESVNDQQKTLLARRVIEHYGERLEGRRIAVWGLSFKPGTDDLREAPSLAILRLLSERGADILAHDPVAIPAARRLLGSLPGLGFVDEPECALEEADALLIVTEWREYRELDLGSLALRMRAPLVLDGRNQFDPRAMAAKGLVYRSIGRPTQVMERVTSSRVLGAAEQAVRQPGILKRTTGQRRNAQPVIEQ